MWKSNDLLQKAMEPSDQQNCFQMILPTEVESLVDEDLDLAEL